MLSREAVADFLSTAGILILPLAYFKTPYRGISSKIYEYQAVGKPIICCSNGLPSEFVKQTQCGLVVNSGDYKELVRSILELSQKPDSANTLGQNGLKFVEREGSIDAVGKNMRLFLEHALSSPA